MSDIDVLDDVDLDLAVDAGCEFMDALTGDEPERKRWYWIVNPDTLDMGDPHRCLLAQYSPPGDYHPGDFGLTEDDAAALGFDGRWDADASKVYRALTALWVEAINDRRAAWLERAG